MNVKEYEGYKPIVSFFVIEEDIYFKYQENIQQVSEDTINALKEELELPYKISFIGLSMPMVARIIDSLKQEESQIFYYRIKNLQTVQLSFHAIFTEKQKIMKK